MGTRGRIILKTWNMENKFIRAEYLESFRLSKCRQTFIHAFIQNKHFIVLNGRLSVHVTSRARDTFNTFANHEQDFDLTDICLSVTG